MTVITIPKKEYTELKKKQAQTEQQVALLRKIVEQLTRDEVKPAYLKKLERQSAALDAGKGKRFDTLKQFRSYLAAL